MRAYLLVVFVHLTLLIDAWLFLPLWLLVLLPVTVSQGTYQLGRCILKPINFEELLSQ